MGSVAVSKPAVFKEQGVLMNTGDYMDAEDRIKLAEAFAQSAKADEIHLEMDKHIFNQYQQVTQSIKRLTIGIIALSIASWILPGFFQVF